MAVEVGIMLLSSTDVAVEARQVEALGYDYACAGEHVSFNVPTGNAFVTLSVAAGATSTIKLLSTIVLAPLYPPALLAKLGAALHAASGGRFSLGVGVGGENPAEFEACGVPVQERGARTDEALEVVRLLWSQDHAAFAGRFSTFGDVTIAPRRDPPPALWVSGRSAAAMRRAARFGDGWIPYMYTPEMLAGSLTTVRSQREGDAALRGGVFIWGCVHEDAAVARRSAVEALSRTYAQDFSRLVDRYAFAGTPDDVAGRLLEFADAGAELVVVSFACRADAVEPTRRLFSEAVLPRLRTA